MIVLHYTGMPTGEAALARLTTAGTDVSSHYLIFEDGRIVQSVPERERAWHAGLSSWEGVSDINSRSIGIEIVNPGHEHGYRDFPSVQIDAVIALCRDVRARWAMRMDRIVAHSDIAPDRKQDPGERFPWAVLAAEGLGLWVPPADVSLAGEAVARDAAGAEVLRTQEALAALGYGLATTGIYDTDTMNVVAAFQRRFRPAKVDGIADASTQDTLHRLCARRDTILEV